MVLSGTLMLTMHGGIDDDDDVAEEPGKSVT